MMNSQNVFMLVIITIFAVLLIGTLPNQAAISTTKKTTPKPTTVKKLSTTKLTTTTTTVKPASKKSTKPQTTPKASQAPTNSQTTPKASTKPPTTPKASTNPPTTPKVSQAPTNPPTTPKASQAPTNPPTTPKAPTNPPTTPKAPTNPPTTPKAPTNPQTTPKASQAPTNPPTTPKAPTNPQTTPKASQAPTNPPASSQAQSQVPTNPQTSPKASTNRPTTAKDLINFQTSSNPPATLSKIPSQPGTSASVTGSPVRNENVNDTVVLNIAQLALASFAKKLYTNSPFSLYVSYIISARSQLISGGTLWNINLVAKKYDDGIFIETDICQFSFSVAPTIYFLNSSCDLYNDSFQNYLTTVQAPFSTQPNQSVTLNSTFEGPSIISYNVSETQVINIARLALVLFSKAYFSNSTFSFSVNSISSATTQSVKNGTVWSIDLIATKYNENAFIEANECVFLVLVTQKSYLLNSTCISYNGPLINTQSTINPID